MGATGLATTPAEYRGRLLEQPDEQLDAWAAEAMRDISIRRGVLAVLHDLTLARHFFPRLVVLDGGRVVADGPPAAVLTRERVRSVFGVDVALTGGPLTGGPASVDRAHSGG